MIPQKFTLYLGEIVSGDLYPSLIKDGEVILGTKVVGLKGFIEFLELHLGIRSDQPGEALQLESYLQALEKAKAGSFYEQSLATDPYSVSRDLYEKRSELLEAGFVFDLKSLPKRFEDLSQVENIFQLKHSLADRAIRVSNILSEKACHNLGVIHLLRQRVDFPELYLQILRKLESQSVVINELSLPTHLPKIKKVKVKNELEAGHLINVLQKKIGHTLVYLKRDEDIFDLFGRQMGGASVGAEVSSFSRPLMQLVYLSTEFLWDPLDPRRVIEFFNLPIKPLPGKLCSKLAGVLAKTPGFGGKEWKKEIEQYLLEENDDERKKKTLKRLDLFFNGKRFPKTGADIKEIAEMFSFLSSYLRAREFLIESNAVNSICHLLNLIAVRKKHFPNLR